jgi:predicted membrane chloride channel (bestrophin family)
MKKSLPSILLMITCTIVHLYFTHLGQELNRKRFIVSGIVLTLLGFIYSTIQTIIIIKAGRRTNEKH